MMGLMSISRSWGNSQTISETRSSTCSSASMSTAVAPRHSPSVSLTRARSIRLRARNWFNGGQLHGPVVHEFDHGAAGAEGDHRAERIVGDQADVDLAAALVACHVLDGHAVDARIRLVALHRLHHVVVSVAHTDRIHDVERHTVDIGLVGDVGASRSSAPPGNPAAWRSSWLRSRCAPGWSWSRECGRPTTAPSTPSRSARCGARPARFRSAAGRPRCRVWPGWTAAAASAAAAVGSGRRRRCCRRRPPPPQGCGRSGSWRC
jgi:hypothetical protein